MFTGANPFAEETTITGHSLRPRVRIAGVRDGLVDIDVEMVDAEDRAVFTISRQPLRIGESITLNDITIEIAVKEKL